MSSLWTPDGERPVNSEAGAPGAPDDPDMPTEEEMREYAEALRQQLANTPAATVVANHCYGLFELAALHLSWQPPNMAEAQLAIEALTGLLDRVGDDLEEHSSALREGLAQLQMAYVQIAEGGGEAPPPPPPPA